MSEISDRPSENLNFSQALALVQDDFPVERKVWGGTWHVYVEDHCKVVLSGGIYRGVARQYARVLCIYDRQNDLHTPGWLPNTEDLFATDWRLVPDRRR